MSRSRAFTMLALVGATAACSRAPAGDEAGHLAEAQQAATSPTCITIERGVAGDATDATMNFAGPTKNYGTTSSLTVSSGSAGLRNGLLRFDLSPIPAGAAITSATARLTVMLYGGAPVVAHRALAPWSETTVTWSSFGGAFSPTVEATFPATGTPSADITALVQGWVSGSIPNHGIVLERPTDGSTVFAASEFLVSQRPRLDVCYVATSCSDGIQNQGETGVDCGGPCAPCGLCAGVVCPAPDACHTAGACDPATGVCSTPAKPDGTACDDGNAGTTGDVCTAGVCAGVDRCAGVTCAALDACHLAGACDPTTGQCSNPTAPDGTACSDPYACTVGDTCQAGSCHAGVNTCGLCETGAPGLGFVFPEWLVDGQALGTDGRYLYLAGGPSRNLHTIDPVTLSVVHSAFMPSVGNTSLAVMPSRGELVWGSAGSIPGVLYRAHLDGSVAQGPASLPGYLRAYAWDDAAGELHVLRGEYNSPGDIVVTDASFDVLGGYGAGHVRDPIGISVNAAQGRVAITDYLGRALHLFDRATHAWSSSTPLGFYPRGVALTDAGTLWIADTTSNTVLNTDLAGNLAQRLTGFVHPLSVLFHEPTGCLFVTDNRNTTAASGGVDYLHRFCPCG